MDFGRASSVRRSPRLALSFWTALRSPPRGHTAGSEKESLAAPGFERGAFSFELPDERGFQSATHRD